MAIVQKSVRILYQAKGNATGLSDVKAQIYFNGVAKAVNTNALTLTEVDSTNSPGLYELLIPASTLTTYGVVTGQTNTLEGYINSASKPAFAPFREELTVANTDDISSLIGTPVTTSIAGDIAAIQTKLGTPAGASVSADILTANTNISAIKTDLESGTASLANILSNIQILQNASIGNGVGFVLPSMLIPQSGSNTYRIPITIQNDAGALVDPASNTITIGVLNAAGTDRGSFLTGSSGTPATVVATRDSVGQYHAVFVLPSTEVEEQLLFSFAYTIGSNSMVRYGQSQTTADYSAEGFALQSTLLATQTTVNNVNSVVTNATYGNSALQVQAAATKTELDAVQASINNATYGLSALQVQGAASQGSGFTAGTDDLHSISAFVRAAIFTGGRAV